MTVHQMTTDQVYVVFTKNVLGCFLDIVTINTLVLPSFGMGAATMCQMPFDQTAVGQKSAEV